MAATVVPDPFVGRSRELQTLRGALDRARDGRGGVVLIAGEPGIGKTRLAEEFVRSQAAAPARALWGRCYDAEGAPAFWPWTQLLQVYARAAGPTVFAEDAHGVESRLARLAPDLFAASEGAPRTGAAIPPEGAEPSDARFDLIDALAVFWRRAAQREPLLLLMEDLHWADAASALALEYLGHELLTMPLLVVATFRDAETLPRTPLSRAAASLARNSAHHRINLVPWTESETAAYTALVLGASEARELAASVQAETQGNPFFVTEVVRLHSAASETGEPKNRRSPLIPQSIRDVMNQRIARLPDACLRAVTLASVIGQEFSVAVLELAIEGSGRRLLDALEEAEMALLIEGHGAPGRYRFQHALVREALYDSIAASARPQLHRQVAHALETLYASALDEHANELAHHFCQAAPAGDREEAVRYARRAAANALRMFAYEDAARNLQLALEVMEMIPATSDAERCEVLIDLGAAFRQVEDYDRAEPAFLRAAEYARRLGRSADGAAIGPGLLARAALGYSDCFLGARLWAVDLRCILLCREALHAIGDAETSLRARLMASFARCLYTTGEREEQEALSRDAIAMARRAGDGAAIASTLTAAHFALWRPDNAAERLEIGRELQQLGDALDDPALVLDSGYVRLVALLELGDAKGTAREMTAHDELAAVVGRPYDRWVVAFRAAMSAILSGRLDEAQALAEQARALGERGHVPDAGPVYGIQNFAIRWLQGRLDEMDRAVVIPGASIAPVLRCGLAVILSEVGHMDAARAQFEGLIHEHRTTIPADPLWTVAMVLLSEACCNLGDRDRASELYEVLLPLAGRTVVVAQAVTSYGPVDFFLGRLAAVAGRRDTAAAHLDAAMAIARTTNARPWLARAQYERAALMATSEGDAAHADRATARALAAEARAAADEMGMRRLAGQCAGLLESLDAGTRAPAYPNGLTAREVEVLRLLAAGKTNRQIAEALVISRNTVLHHVSNIYGKAGVANRTEAATYAVRMGLTEDA